MPLRSKELPFPESCEAQSYMVLANRCPQGILGIVVLDSYLEKLRVGEQPAFPTRFAPPPATLSPILHILTLSQALPDMLGLINHARSIWKIELLAWGWGQRELLMLSLHHQLCWAPAGLEDLVGREEVATVGSSLRIFRGPPSACPPLPQCWRFASQPQNCHNRKLSVHLPRGKPLSNRMLRPRRRLISTCV